MPLKRAETSLAVALFVVLTFAAVSPVRSYDSFWHLATGRWIIEHHALPATDPFAVASDRIPWINGEWLFQIVLRAVEMTGGVAAICWSRAAFVAALFALVFVIAARRSSWPFALAASTIGFAGSATLLDVRPSTVAAASLASAIALLSRRTRLSQAAYIVLTIVWINVHPSALLAPILATLAWSGPLLPIASGLALLVNPHGIHGVLAPLHLMSFVGSGGFVNAEWLPSTPVDFPLLYTVVGVGALLIGISERRREDWWRIAVFALLAFLALRHVRNQPLLLASMPLLLAPFAGERLRKVPQWLAVAIACVAIGTVAVRTSHRTGVEGARFPVAAVARLRSSGLRGNVYNPDQFGGYLIWSLYGERRVLTDGRNELYRTFIDEYAAARLDGRKWNALLARYRIDLAVDEYRPMLPVRDVRTGKESPMPASLAYWPRRQWALIAYDDAGMVFARRSAFAPEVISKWEIPGVVPDAR